MVTLQQHKPEIEQFQQRRENKMPSTKILIVDNDPNTTQDLQVRLSKLGYEVIGTAATSEVALLKSTKLKPSLIMMNTRLRSGNDGIKTGKLIHTNSDTPIIYFSSSVGQETIRRASSTGPFGYIIQPFDNSQLFVTIEVAQIRYKLESQLRESEQWLNGVLMSISDGVIAVDNIGFIRFINSKAEKITGWKGTDAIGKMLYEVLQLKDEISGELLDLSANLSQAQEDRKGNSGIEALLIVNDGSRIFLEINLNPIVQYKDNLQGLVLAFRDITAQRQAKEQIKQQTNRAEALVKVAEQLNSRLEFKEVLDTVCTVTNQVLKTSATVIFLYDPKSNLFKDMAKKIEGGSYQVDKNSPRITFDHDTFQKFLPADNSVFSISDVKVNKNIPYRHILRLLKIRSLALAPLIRNGDVIGILICGSVGNNRSYSKDELELLKGLADHVSVAISNASMFEQVRKGRERQRVLAKSLVDVQEAERRHIARELHDHLGQSLTGLQFMLETTKKGAANEQKQQLDEIQKFVGDIIMQIREMSLNLRPSMLDDIGLIPTLKWHFERYANQTGIKVNFRSDNFISRLPGEIETAAYRIVQEALTNVARYAQVKDVFVGLASQENTLWVEVLDQGKGFDASTASDKPTAGLGGMRERADLLGGYLSINSYLNQGTQILAALPITNKPLERRKNDRKNLSG